MSRAATIRSVLLVDDEADIRLIGQVSLQDVGGWETVTAASGEEALALTAVRSFDVILLDVMMPMTDGPTTLAALRARGVTKATPIIFMTAKARKHEVAAYLSLGAAGVIAKPFDAMRLPEEVRRIVAAVGQP